MKAMETIQDLIEEAKLRTVWWSLCVFVVTYFLTHTSTSMWMNLPIAILIVCGLRILSNEVEFRWKAQVAPRQSYLYHLEKKQLSLNDLRLSSAPLPTRWKRKIDSPTVEAAINDLIDKILKDFVVDLWYSEITSDREAPELIRAVIMDAIGEISGRVKEINLVDLLTRDLVDLIGDHLELFRRYQALIGVDVMKTLSSEERDERLKYHLMASGELYPALISPESEYKVLQRIVSGLLSVVLRPRDAQCPLVRTIAREIVTCLVVQPLLNLASPDRINEVIECIITALKEGNFEGFAGEGQSVDSSSRKSSSFDHQASNMTLAKIDDQSAPSSESKKYQGETMQPQPADWARMLEVATQRRTEVLTPENLENMWTKGRNYKKKEYKKALKKGSLLDNLVPTGHTEINSQPETSAGSDWKVLAVAPQKASLENQVHGRSTNRTSVTDNFSKASSFEGRSLVCDVRVTEDSATNGSKNRLKRSNSTSDLKPLPDTRKEFVGGNEGPFIKEFYSPDFVKHGEEYKINKRALNIIQHKEGSHVPKLRCRVLGAYFEKLGSKSFAVYSIAVTDAQNKTWFVKRRYSNFERLHRTLKDIPNYNLHLPPKRIFSSSTEDAFVHQRCIQLDKYLQDLLSIANVAEQHEVWDFLSVYSKNYSFGKSSSVMRTLAVNVDDAMDDIMRQFKGVSDGLMRKVVGPSSSLDGTFSPISSQHLSLNADEINKHVPGQTSESVHSTSDIEDVGKDGGGGHDGDRLDAEASGWHSDNELNSKGFPPRVIRCAEGCGNSLSGKHDLDVKSELSGITEFRPSDSLTPFNYLEDPAGMPPEWTPPHVSVPVLNLVDKVFQLKRRGWLRRQVFWMSKQILHLVMDDAIDDWLLGQIRWLRKEDTVAQGIRWVQDILWPNGVFFTRVGDAQSTSDGIDPSEKPFQMMSQISETSRPGSFEQQLEASRRASELKKLLFDGAPTTLVSLVGPKQYRRCARDIFYFTQSTICVKQLAYAILELLIKSVFPELQDLLKDIREKTNVYQSKH